MRSTIETPAEYLENLPSDRRDTVARVRGLVLEHLRPGFEEGMQYGMLTYCVPHSLYPKGYHVNPKLPLPFLSLAAQKNYYALYLMCLYPDSELCNWFAAAWHETGKKLDMGKSCIRFKRMEALALDVIAKLLQRVTVDDYVAAYETALTAPRTRPTKAPSRAGQTKGSTKTKTKTKPVASAATPRNTKTKPVIASTTSTKAGTKAKAVATKSSSARLGTKPKAASSNVAAAKQPSRRGTK